MVRKMAYVGFSYLAGLFFASFLNSFIALAIASCAAFMSVICLIFYKYEKIKLCVCIISCSCGLILYSLYNIFVYQNIIKYDGHEVILNGKIVSCTDYSNDKTRYTLKGVINKNVTAVVTCFSDSKDCRIGDYVYVSGTAEAFENTYDFAAENYYKSKGIFLSIEKVQSFEVIKNHSFCLLRYIQNYRDYLCKIIRSYLPQEESSVIIAMLFGDKSDISDTTKTLLYRAGIGHIMAVSGVHLTVAAIAVAVFFRLLKANKYVSFAALMLVVTAFSLLAGASQSVIRAAVMIAIVYGSDLFKRRYDTLNSLGIAIVALTVTMPFAVRDASFLLSVGGVFGVGVLAPVIIKTIEQKFALSKLTKSFIASLSAIVVIFPISMLFFDEVSIISPITNIALLPLCICVLIFGIIIALTGGIAFIAVPLLSVSGLCCRVIVFVSEAVGRKSWAYVPLGYSFTIYLVLLSIIIITVTVIKTKSIPFTAFVSFLVTCLSIAFIFVYKFNSDDRITVAVIGNEKASVMIVHDNKTACIIDLKGGAKNSYSVCKYLNRIGINRIDAIILNVDSLTSQAIYMNNLKLFNIDSVLVPDEDYLLNDKTILGKVTVKYDNENSVVHMRNYDVEFTENNTVCVKYKDKILLAANGGEEYHKYDGCNIFIDYYGTEPQMNNSGIYIALNEKACVLTCKNRAVFIGENTETVLYENGKIKTEEIANGIGQ